MTVERWLHLAGALLTVTLVRGMAVFLLALAVTTLAKKLASETRHLVWLGVIATFVLIPLAWLLLPAIPIGAGIPSAAAAPLRLAAAPALSAGEYVRLVEGSGAPPVVIAESPPLSVFAVIGLSLVCAWLAGVMVLVMRLAVAKGRLARLAAQARAEPHLQAEADGLAWRMEVARRIPVLLSPKCRIPFAFGILRPRILLPREAARWPAGRLHSALTHELAHIRRRDLAVQTACYAVCVLLWFLPPLWLAYAAMLREAETCCDQQVIDRGFRGPEYAQDIVELARSCEGRILLPSISSAVGRKSMLKERIRRVLRLEPGRHPFGTRTAVRVLAICLACAVPILALSAQARPSVEPLYATWVKEDAGTGKGSAQKCVIFPDGRELDYLTLADQEPWWESKLEILNQWRDKEGNYWYELNFKGWYPEDPDKSDATRGSKGYSLVKVSASGATIESVTAESRIPDKEDWSLIPHPTYYRWAELPALSADDPLFGTWLNPSYEDSVVEVAAKLVIFADGSELDYSKIAARRPSWVSTYKLEAAWVDEEGNHWYKTVWVGDSYPLPFKEPRFKCHSLIRVNAAGTVLDTMCGGETAYPQDLKDSSLGGTPMQYKRQ